METYHRVILNSYKNSGMYYRIIRWCGWNMNKKIVILFIIGNLFFISGCFNQNTDTLQKQLAQQQEEIRQLKSQLSGVQPAQADTWAQVQNLRQEIASVVGQIDDFNHATSTVGGLSGLAAKVAKNEAAIQKIEKQFDIKLLGDIIVPMAANVATEPPIFSTSNNHNATNEKKKFSPIEPQGNGEKGQSLPNTSVQTAAAVNVDTANILYDTGIKFFNERKYKEALKSFTDFTETYKTHKLVSNAWFWRGESNYQLGNFPAAALDYEQVISKYPKSGKVTSSYLKQGLCFVKTGKKDAAKFRFEEILKKFPNSPEAKRAKQLLKSGS